MASRRETIARREQLRLEVARACRSGEWTPGQMVPTLGELTARYGLSNGVVHQEIKRLTEEGLLYSVPRVGTFVAYPAGTPQPANAPRDGSRSLSGEEKGLRDTVALLSPGLLGPPQQWHPSGWANAVDQGAAHALHQHRFHVLSLHPDNFSGDLLEPQELERLCSRHLFGLVITDTEGMGEALRQALQERGFPVVGLDNHPRMGACDRVISDHHAGGYLLTRWVLAQGRRRLLNLWPQPASGYWFPLRAAGFIQAMGEAGLEASMPLLAPFGRPANAEEFANAAHQLAEQLRPYVTGSGGNLGPVDALMLASDGYTPLTAAALRVLGLVPNQDVLLAGYDNYWRGMPYREYDAEAPCVTVDKGNWNIGEEAVNLLVQRGQGQLPAEWQTRVVAPRLLPVDRAEADLPPLRSGAGLNQPSGHG